MRTMRAFRKALLFSLGVLSGGGIAYVLLYAGKGGLEGARNKRKSDSTVAVAKGASKEDDYGRNGIASDKVMPTVWQLNDDLMTGWWSGKCRGATVVVHCDGRRGQAVLDIGGERTVLPVAIVSYDPHRDEFVVELRNESGVSVWSVKPGGSATRKDASHATSREHEQEDRLEDRPIDELIVERVEGMKRGVRTPMTLRKFAPRGADACRNRPQAIERCKLVKFLQDRLVKK